MPAQKDYLLCVREERLCMVADGLQVALFKETDAKARTEIKNRLHAITKEVHVMRNEGTAPDAPNFKVLCADREDMVATIKELEGSKVRAIDLSDRAGLAGRLAFCDRQLQELTDLMIQTLTYERAGL